MQWKKLICDSRAKFSKKKSENFRSEFQRDFDRIVFSNAFRRLQGKTQVFPFPDNDVIHNRLTHSLEVSCVGRSLGVKIADKMQKENPKIFPKRISKHDIGVIVASSCLIHDLGNPPFGHTGENIIREYFKKNKSILSRLKLNKQEKRDFLNFEGNALALRLLRKNTDLQLTFATLASFIKYPTTVAKNHNKNNNYIGFKKFGVFQSETLFFNKIMKKTGISPLDSSTNSYFRHPLSFLTEAADDICYNIIDLEDAHRAGVITKDEVRNWYLKFIPKKELENKDENLSKLRAKVINYLANQVVKVFWDNKTNLIECPGKIKLDLISQIKKGEEFNELKKFSVEKIYSKKIISQKEIGAIETINKLLDCFIQILLEPPDSLSSKAKIAKNILPDEYQITSNKNNKQDSNPSSASENYEKLMLIVEFIAGMTDSYAVKLGEMIRFPQSSSTIS